MSRAININAASPAVVAMCAKHKVEVSAIETLPSGATRVVLRTIDDADAIRRAFRTKLLPVGATRYSYWKSSHA
jgi:hypothetical protein